MFGGVHPGFSLSSCRCIGAPDSEYSSVMFFVFLGVYIKI